MSHDLEITGVIPARYASTRFPGKPLALIGCKPMIQWVYEQARQSKKLNRVLVATDDSRIRDAVCAFGGEAVMTTATCASGTDRVAEAVRNRKTDIVVNIQGDEPFIHPKAIDLVAEVLIHDAETKMGTLVKRIFHEQELTSPHVVKVIINQKGYALYFSRNAIPFYRDSDEPTDWIKNHVYYKHLGIYSYRSEFLQEMSQWKPTSLETAEKLEQLRVLEHGVLIKVAETDSETVSVDTPEDLERVRRIYEKQETRIKNQADG